MGLISNGSTIFDNGSMASGFGGNMVFISKATASSSASIEFTLGDYKEYQFYFVDIHPQNDNVDFQFNLSTDGGSNYNVTKTTTFFRAYHGDAGGEYTAFNYEPTRDLAQSSSFATITFSIGNDNDETGAGTLQIFNPSSSVFVKHFIARTSATIFVYDEADDQYTAGYGNTTSPINSIKFQMSSGNIDAGSILMFGIN